MTTVSRFVRSVRSSDLTIHLSRYGISVPENLEADLAQSVIDSLPSDTADEFSAEIERIAAMVDDLGQQALLAMREWRQRILEIEGSYARAHWLYLLSPDAFRQAEEIRFADENQDAQKLWDAFVGPVHAPLKTSENDMATFRAAIAEALDLDRLHIDRFERIRQSEGEPDRSVVQLTIYSEDVPKDDLVLIGNGVVNRPRKQVRETAIVYEAASGTIEVMGKQKATRQQVAFIFAKTLLEAEISGERLPPRRFDLTSLLDRHVFPTRPEDRIAKVKVTKLTLSSSDNRLTQQFQVPFKDDKDLYGVLEEHYGDDSPLNGDLYPWSARIEVEFEPSTQRKRGKKISIDLCAPHKCSLRGKTAHERSVLSYHLRAWGLQRGNAA